MSYVYDDLRRTVFGDDASGAVVCSTIEQAVTDNTFQAGLDAAARLHHE